MNHIPQNFVGIELADPTYYKPGPIDILIGADKFFDVIKGGSKHISNSNLVSIPTIFGCVIAGGILKLSDDSVQVNSLCTRIDHEKVFDLERFWKVEEISVETPLSVEEQLAEDLFVKNTTRRLDGRYEVFLPFKPSMALEFGNSLGTAISRFYSVEKRFQNNDDLKSQYCGFINEYLALGHMEEIPSNELKTDQNAYYLPHHAIFKDDSTTTKIRIVFDASARSNNSISLNDSLLVGPTIQRDLFSICLRYRLHLYVISGDIEKMYRQIWITKGHTDFQRIVWRNSPTEPLKHYRLLTVTYGTASAPFSAVRVLKQLALDSATTYPVASKTLQNDFYVDDVVTGTDNIDDIFALQSELVALLGSAGFNLRKWTTNCQPLLLRLPEDQRELSPVDFENSTSVKILGLQWCPSRDCFSYKVKLSDSTACTKRRILSDASRLFDPLGFLAPVIVGVKIIFQELWRRKLAWDDEVPQDLALQWTTIRDELPTLESLSIPRLMVKNKLNWELHGFCDASLDAYAASVYCRSISSDGMISVELVAAKSKVAPIKVLSLPRLELSGAVLLTRLINKIKLSLQEPNIKTFAWTDSSIVLHWLSAPPKKWSVFIANRTSEVLSSIHFKQWNHVRTTSNPADLATRGISPSSLASANLWWNGPVWLSKEVDQWPVSNLKENINKEHLEERKVSLTQTMLQGFWSRWHREYLTSLQQRPKWQTSKPNLRVDDVVLLKEPNLPPSKWVIGRIIKTHPGDDERIRVVTVKTKFGEYLRPVVKVSPLPFSERP
ncbi:uncharacterized protein LOC129952067 [Eupeodes corollae]|uniref:uncharacterized protein LOC129952067 n=1 Tax=Eupeodes corollae TaxID=290404 RepID=UPI00249230DE|nr:uncharacterized protein LOC129952067 [Eupeodes corollae]